MHKVSVYQDEIVSVESEIRDGVVFIHSHVHKFSPSSLKHMREVFATIKEEFLLNGIECIFAYTPNPKFAKLIDNTCEVLDEIRHRDKTYEVLVWDSTP